MKAVTIVGARPQFVKVALLRKTLLASGVHDILVHTGQHHDVEMSDVFFKELEIGPPDVNLGIFSGKDGACIHQMITPIEEVLAAERPYVVIVFGDTASTLAGALVANRLNIPVAHVEAGLRSFNSNMPEEVYRANTDRIARWLFAPSQVAVDNLRAEGIDAGVEVVGDVMRDAVDIFSPIAERKSKVLQELDLVENGYAVATFHRQDNVDNVEILSQILAGLKEIGDKVVFPVHPRTKRRLSEFGLGLPANVVESKPFGYLDTLKLVMSAKAVVTDSGGLQKEAYWLGSPCLTIRSETEWVETVESGWNILAEADPRSMVNAYQRLDPPRERPNLYGDGQACRRIVDTLISRSKKESAPRKPKSVQGVESDCWAFDLAAFRSQSRLAFPRWVGWTEALLNSWPGRFFLSRSIPCDERKTLLARCQSVADRSDLRDGKILDEEGFSSSNIQGMLSLAEVDHATLSRLPKCQLAIAFGGDNDADLHKQWTVAQKLGVDLLISELLPDELPIKFEPQELDSFCRQFFFLGPALHVPEIEANESRNINEFGIVFYCPREDAFDKSLLATLAVEDDISSYIMVTERSSLLKALKQANICLSFASLPQQVQEAELFCKAYDIRFVDLGASMASPFRSIFYSMASPQFESFEVPTRERSEIKRLREAIDWCKRLRKRCRVISSEETIRWWDQFSNSRISELLERLGRPEDSKLAKERDNLAIEAFYCPDNLETLWEYPSDGDTTSVGLNNWVGRPLSGRVAAGLCDNLHRLPFELVDVSRTMRFCSRATLFWKIDKADKEALVFWLRKALLQRTIKAEDAEAVIDRFDRLKSGIVRQISLLASSLAKILAEIGEQLEGSRRREWFELAVFLYDRMLDEDCPWQGDRYRLLAMNDRSLEARALMDYNHGRGIVSEYDRAVLAMGILGPIQTRLIIPAFRASKQVDLDLAKELLIRELKPGVNSQNAIALLVYIGGLQGDVELLLRVLRESEGIDEFQRSLREDQVRAYYWLGDECRNQDDLRLPHSFTMEPPVNSFGVTLLARVACREIREVRSLLEQSTVSGILAELSTLNPRGLSFFHSFCSVALSRLGYSIEAMRLLILGTRFYPQNKVFESKFGLSADLRSAFHDRSHSELVRRFMDIVERETEKAFSLGKFFK